MVLVDENPPPGQVVVSDLSFVFSDAEIRKVLFVQDYLYVLALDRKEGLWGLFYGDKDGTAWKQIGKFLTESPTSFWTDGQDAIVIVNRSQVLGMGCYTLPVAASKDTPWSECSGFPDYVRDFPDDEYSVLAKIFGDPTCAAAWFEVKTQTEQWYRVHSFKAEQQWPGMDLGVGKKPQSWVCHENFVLIAYLAKAATHLAELAAVRPDRSLTSFALAGHGLPDAQNDWSGVQRLCAAGTKFYAFYLDYSDNASSLRVFAADIP